MGKKSDSKYQKVGQGDEDPRGIAMNIQLMEAFAIVVVHGADCYTTTDHALILKGRAALKSKES